MDARLLRFILGIELNNDLTESVPILPLGISAGSLLIAALATSMPLFLGSLGLSLFSHFIYIDNLILSIQNTALHLLPIPAKKLSRTFWLGGVAIPLVTSLFVAALGWYLFPAITRIFSDHIPLLEKIPALLFCFIFYITTFLIYASYQRHIIFWSFLLYILVIGLFVSHYQYICDTINSSLFHIAGIFFTFFLFFISIRVSATLPSNYIPIKSTNHPIVNEKKSAVYEKETALQSYWQVIQSNPLLSCYFYSIVGSLILVAYEISITLLWKRIQGLEPNTFYRTYWLGLYDWGLLAMISYFISHNYKTALPIYTILPVSRANLFIYSCAIPLFISLPYLSTRQAFCFLYGIPPITFFDILLFVYFNFSLFILIYTFDFGGRNNESIIFGFIFPSISYLLSEHMQDEQIKFFLCKVFAIPTILLLLKLWYILVYDHKNINNYSDRFKKDTKISVNP